MELFHKRKSFNLVHILFLFSLVINVHCAIISYDFHPKETRQILGEKFLFSLAFTGENYNLVKKYDSVNVYVTPKLDSKKVPLRLIYSFPVLKKPGVEHGAIGKEHQYYGHITDIKTTNTRTRQTFSMMFQMICQLSTNFKYALINDSVSQFFGQNTLESYSITSLGVSERKPIYYPGDKIKVDCQINQCNSKGTNVMSLWHKLFLLTSKEKFDSSISPINSSATVISYHDNIIDTQFTVSKYFVITCVPLHINCALCEKTWTKRRNFTAHINRTFCRNKNTEIRVEWGNNNYTNHMKYVEDGAVFKTICTVFTSKGVNMVSEGQPTKVISRTSITTKRASENPGEFVIQQTTTYQHTDFFCHYPRNTFRCFLNNSAESSKTSHITFRPIACEPKFMSFNALKDGSGKVNLSCIIRKPIGEKIRNHGILDANSSVNTFKYFKRDTGYGRNRNAMIITVIVAFESCEELKSRNLICWYNYDGRTFTTKLNTRKLCEGGFLWLLWLLLILSMPLLLCCLFLCVGRCRRNKRRMEALIERLRSKERKEKEIEEPSKRKPAVAKEIEAMRMYRMFKKRRPFGWRELNDHFLWLSMMAQDEQRSGSVTPSAHDYAQFRLMKKRTRFGNRELLSFSQTLMQPAGRADDDLATIPDFENNYGNWSQLTVSPELSNPDSKKDAQQKQILSHLHNEGAVGAYNQLESYEYVQEGRNPQVRIKINDSDSSSSEAKTKSNKQRASRQQKKKKRRRSRHSEDVV